MYEPASCGNMFSVHDAIAVSSWSRNVSNRFRRSSVVDGVGNRIPLTLEHLGTKTDTTHVSTTLRDGEPVQVPVVHEHVELARWVNVHDHMPDLDSPTVDRHGPGTPADAAPAPTNKEANRAANTMQGRVRCMTTSGLVPGLRPR